MVGLPGLGNHCLAMALHLCLALQEAWRLLRLVLALESLAPVSASSSAAATMGSHSLQAYKFMISETWIGLRLQNAEDSGKGTRRLT